MAISKINSKSIADGTVVGADITPGTVTNAKISPSAAIANAKLANSSISINGSSVSLGGSATINTAIDWQAVTVADGSTQVVTTAGKGYFLDTNAGVIEAFLPASPTRGDRVVLADYSGTFATNQAIVNTGGENLDSTIGSEYKLTTNNTIAEFIYVDSNKGWLVYLNQAAGSTPSLSGNPVYNQDEFITATGGTLVTSPCGSFRTHIFTGDGCLAVTAVSACASAADYLVVAGGGAGAASFQGAGGAGGLRLSNSLSLPAPTTSPLASCTGITLTATTYPITVGAGGTGATSTVGTNGSNSIFSTITSTGGGYGAYAGGTGGNSGGSGGGGAGKACGQPNTAPVGYPNPLFGPTPSGNTPPTSPAQGTNGGAGFHRGAISSGGGGGGGAGAAGGNAYDGPYAGTAGGTAYILTKAAGGNGGSGTYIDNTFIGPTAPCYGTPGPVGSTRYFGGGGGGGGGAGAYDLTPIAEMNAGGKGGGGYGQTPSNMPTCACRASTSGTANTGGGAGGGSITPSTGANGGKGIVIIRYRINSNN